MVGRFLRLVVVEGISTLGRNTQGVRLIRTSDEEKLVQVVRVVNEGDGEEGESAAGSQDTSPQATGAGSEVSADSTGDGVADESPDPNSDAGDAAKDPEDN